MRERDESKSGSDYREGTMQKVKSGWTETTSCSDRSKCHLRIRP